MHGGAAPLAPSVTRRLRERFAASPDPTAAAHRLKVLTERERMVLVALARGMSNADVGSNLYMPEATVKARVSRILSKLGMNNRGQAAILVHEPGWV